MDDPVDVQLAGVHLGARVPRLLLRSAVGVLLTGEMSHHEALDDFHAGPTPFIRRHTHACLLNVLMLSWL